MPFYAKATNKEYGNFYGVEDIIPYKKAANIAHMKTS